MINYIISCRFLFAYCFLVALFLSQNVAATDSTIELNPIINREIGQFWNNLPGTGSAGISLATRKTINIFHRTLLQFNLPTSGIGTITGAKLRIFCTNQSEYITNTVHASRVTENWDANATWSLRDETQHWTFPGGTDDGEHDVVISVPSKYTGGWNTQSGPYNEWIEFDVTPIVQGWLNHSFPNYGLLLRETDIDNDLENEELDFVAMEDADSAHHPKLIISADFGEGTLTYEYDHLDQLTKVNSVDGRRVAYQYDASGNRILKTVTSQLICEAGPRMPQPRAIASAASNVSLLQLRLSANNEEALDLQSISIQGLGSALEPAAISHVKAYFDGDSSGEISPGDTLLTSGIFSIDQGRINLRLTTGSLIIPAGDYRDVVIAADLSGTASSGQTLQLGVIDDAWIAARGETSHHSIVPLGAPMTGPVHRISAAPDPTPTPPPPEKPLCVYPADGAVDVTTQTVLTWRNGGGATSYQVFFGPAGNMTLRGNQSATSASYSGLENATEYQWRVDAVNAYGTTPGDVWGFTTAAAPIPAQTPNQPPAWPAEYAAAPANGESVSAHVPFIEITPGAFDADGSIADYLVEIWREDAGTSGSAIADFHAALLGSDIPHYVPSMSFIAGATYKWRMKVFDNEGAASDFTPAMQFTPRPPTVSAVEVQSGRAVDVTFSDPLAGGVLTPGNYDVSGSGQGTLAEHPDSVIGLGGNSYRLSWAGGEMRDGGDVTITVANVADTASNGLGSPNSGTHYGGGIGTTPKLQSGSVESTHSMVCVFDEAMDTSAGLPSAYIIAGNGRGSLAAQPLRVESITSSTFRLGWDEGEMRTGGDLEISARGAGDLAGNILTTASAVALRGAALGVAPNVARVITRSAVTIDVEFSEPVFAGAEDVHHYRLSGNGQGGMAPNPDAVSLTQPNVARLTWTLPAMVQDGDITITVSEVYDLVGNILGAPDSSTQIGGGIARTGAKNWSLFQ